MKQQIVISGLGGQGVLFLTRLLAEAGLEMGYDVLTSETHGMAMRGGTVISHVKIGSFKSPLIRSGCADAGLFLNDSNLSCHGYFLKPEGSAVVNGTSRIGGALVIDALSCARDAGSALVTNLVLLGYAVRSGVLFTGAEIMESVIMKVSRARQADLNREGFRRGINNEGGVL